MARVLLVCSLLALALALVHSQEECGDKICGSDECCRNEGDRRDCMKLRTEYQLCFRNSTIWCPCEQGLECRPLMFFPRCLKPRTTSTSETTSEATTVATTAA